MINKSLIFLTNSRFYYSVRSLIRKTEYLPFDALNKIQFKYLKQMVEYAWTNIPGYRELWNDNNFNPQKLRTLEDIENIPFITKEILRDNIKKFTNKNVIKKNYITTGGSTGIPFGFYEEPKNRFIEMGFINDLWTRKYNPISIFEKSTVLRGAKLDDKTHEYKNRSGLILSSYDLDDNNIQQFVHLIDKYKTPILQAYPSSLYLFAKIVKEKGLKINHRFKAIMLGSEPLYSFQKELISEIFGTNISHWYGASEKVVLAGNCEYDDRFHVYPQYGYTEIINHSIETSNERVGEIVGTSFWNFVTPFIRYRTMDFAKVGKIGCEKCKRNYLLLEEIEGRLQEYIVGKTLKILSMTAINMHDDIFDELKQFKFYQERIGLLEFHYIKRDSIKKVDENKIYKGLMNKLKGEYDLVLHEVSSLEKSSSGKLSFLTQKIDLREIINGKTK